MKKIQIYWFDNCQLALHIFTFIHTLIRHIDVGPGVRVRHGCMHNISCNQHTYVVYPNPCNPYV